MVGTQQAQQQYERELVNVVSVFILMHSLWDLQINASNDHVNRFSSVFLELQETLRWSLHKWWLYTFQITCLKPLAR
jgi:hypothetical protein